MNAVTRVALRWLRRIDGEIKARLYPGEWLCTCGIGRGCWEAECGCTRRDKRPDVCGGDGE